MSRADLNILAVEPYYGGSHRGFLDSLMARSRHAFRAMTLPARKWKWRMRGSAIWFAERLTESPPEPTDLILANDMLSVADLRALVPGALKRCPVVCYFHENQLTYPLSDHDERDYQYGFTNITSCLASDEVWFNSNHHRDAFLAAVDALLRKMPDHLPGGVVREIERRSRVVYPLVEAPPVSIERRPTPADAPRTVLWSHRWEYDKNPKPFFETLFALDRDGVDFRVVLLGESFREAPAVFGEAWSRLATRIVHRGYVPDRDAYWRLLGDCDIVVSTAHQENFGMSVVEAMCAGCRPLLPRRLSYPELIPAELHQACLYDADADMRAKLRGLLSSREVDGDAVGPRLSASLRSICGMDECIHIYDNALCRVCRSADAADPP